MTLVIAAQGLDFLILGADSRVSRQDLAGTRVELNLAVKLIQITKRVGFLIYGDAHISDYLIDKFKERPSLEDKNVSEIAQDFAEFCREEARKTKDVPRSYFPQFGFIIAGLDILRNRVIIPRCYSLRSSEGFQIGIYKEKFAIAGKDVIATYLFSHEYKSDMSVDDLSKLVVKAISDTSKIDGDVGGDIKIARIDETGFTPYAQSDVEDTIQELSSD